MEPLKEGCIARCPGCSHRHMTMQESLVQKESWLKRQLFPWKDTFEPVRSVSHAERWGYRRKILLTTRYEENQWNFGMIRREEFIAIPDCPVHTELTRRLIRLLISVLPPAGEFPLAYFWQSDALVTLVLKTRQNPSMNWFTDNVIHELQHLGVKGFSVHLNPSAGRRMFSKNGWFFLWGSTRTTNESGLTYGRTTFSQLIHSLHQQSLDEAEQFLDPRINDCIVDLYCGTGSSLVRWLKKGALALGVETGGEAIECARIDAPDATILRGACRQRLPQMQEWLDKMYQNGRQKLLYANPPRTGIEAETLEWITDRMRPHKICYLSCSAGTLKRDLDRFTAKNYTITAIIPFDFFPQTHHVECLVMMVTKPNEMENR